MKKIFKLFVFLSFIHILAYAQFSSCDRSAYVNFEKILIDSSSSIKGDGLKVLLEKDEKALEYLNTYQENARPSTKTAFISSMGLGVALGGFLLGNNKASPLNRHFLLGAGLSVIAINFLSSRGKQIRNERNLMNAIYEYNLRNSPKIYFTPYKNGKRNVSLGIGVNKSF